MARKHLTLNEHSTRFLIDRHNFETRASLANQLARHVSERLAKAIFTRGSAVLAVSGGSTPALFFKALSSEAIAWDKVTVILVDERIVPADNDRSNNKLVSECLLIDKAAAATLVSYVVDRATPEECAVASSALLEPFVTNIDALILGMGNDGHTASFFPGGDNLSKALDLQGEGAVITMRAQGAGEPRLTLTLPVVLNARFLALHIEGAEKAEVLDRVLSDDNEKEMPVRSVIKNVSFPLSVFWAP